MVAACFLTACGGPGTYNDALGRSAPPGTELPPNVPGRVLLPSGPVTLAPAGRGQAVAFCQDVAELQRLAASLLAPGGSGSSLRQVKALVDRLQADAPSEIRPAATELGTALTRITVSVQSLPPDIAGLAASALSFQNALQQVTQYTMTHC